MAEEVARRPRRCAARRPIELDRNALDDPTGAAGWCTSRPLSMIATVIAAALAPSKAQARSISVRAGRRESRSRAARRERLRPGRDQRRRSPPVSLDVWSAPHSGRGGRAGRRPDARLALPERAAVERSGRRGRQNGVLVSGSRSTVAADTMASTASLSRSSPTMRRAPDGAARRCRAGRGWRGWRPWPAPRRRRAAPCRAREGGEERLSRSCRTPTGRAALVDERDRGDRTRHVAGALGGGAIEARVAHDVRKGDRLAGREDEADDAFRRAAPRRRWPRRPARRRRRGTRGDPDRVRRWRWRQLPRRKGDRGVDDRLQQRRLRSPCRRRPMRARCADARRTSSMASLGGRSATLSDPRGGRACRRR